MKFGYTIVYVSSVADAPTFYKDAFVHDMGEINLDTATQKINVGDRLAEQNRTLPDVWDIKA